MKKILTAMILPFLMVPVCYAQSIPIQDIPIQVMNQTSLPVTLRIALNDQSHVVLTQEVVPPNTDNYVTVGYFPYSSSLNSNFNVQLEVHLGNSPLYYINNTGIASFVKQGNSLTAGFDPTALKVNGVGYCGKTLSPIPIQAMPIEVWSC